MATAHAPSTKRIWPIAYGRRTRRASGGGTGLAWAFFLGLGFPFGLMALLTALAGAGVYVDLFRPFWLPWPPDLLKPFLGVAVFVASLAYLAYRSGWRSGFRTAAFVRPASARPLPPPPPPDDL